MRAALAKVTAFARDNAASLAIDAIGIAGTALVVAGVWQVYPPLAHIILGAVLIGCSVLLARRLVDKDFR